MRFNRQGCHNGGESITVVPELKRYVRNSETKQQRKRTDTLREALHGGQIVFQDRGFSGS